MQKSPLFPSKSVARRYYKNSLGKCFSPPALSFHLYRAQEYNQIARSWLPNFCSVLVEV